MRTLILCLLSVALLPVLASGCRKDVSGAASLSVRTTFPPGIPATLVSTERVGTYVQKAVTDTANTLHFVGIAPGRYKIIYQFRAPSFLPSEASGYNYGESEPFEVKPGRNYLDWTIGNPSSLTRRER
ncbi:MAG TPA: hypothetical protein VGM37_04435 [Armatimonadota bacterium]|jgi:hypothetical protein